MLVGNATVKSIYQLYVSQTLAATKFNLGGSLLLKICMLASPKVTSLVRILVEVSSCQKNLLYSGKNRSFIKHSNGGRDGWKYQVPSDMTFVHCQAEAYVLWNRKDDANDPFKENPKFR
mmetsp:Transcript_8243/g.15525  ORF Transcript_8243/g.15525 Transcript_8243/m.15525 type:complete len:119 (+) Transcript_8243:44-400(+)